MRCGCRLEPRLALDRLVQRSNTVHELDDLDERAIAAADVDRDFPELGHAVRNPDGLRRWLTAYAAATATTTSFERIRDAATGGHESPPARSTVQPYRDVLERLYVLDEVPGWKPSSNRIAELALPPKHHLADPALAARLLGASASALLRGASPGPTIPRDGTLLGALFESLVTLSVRVYAQAAEATVGHLRTHRGDREVDLIVERDDGRVAYRRPDGIAVVPAALLGP